MREYIKTLRSQRSQNLCFFVLREMVEFNGNGEDKHENVTCDVCVVGYGPVGMILATLLAQYGLNVVVVERHRERYAYHRAGSIDGEIMRVFQALGIAPKAELIGRPLVSMEWITPEREVLAATPRGNSITGWKPTYVFHQPELEKIINARALELGVRVFMDVTASSIKQHSEKAVLTVRSTTHPEATPWSIDASYIIGADGAGSFVRREMGSHRGDLGFQHIDHLVLDIEHLDPDRDITPMQEAYLVLDVKRPTMVARWVGYPSRWSRFEFTRLDNESRESLENEEGCWRLLADWDITPDNAKLVRKAWYTFEASIADKWRAGRVLIVGDAAHTMPPFLGQGMCSGIRDAMNLSWKLNDVFAGNADDKILDTYQIERSPHVLEYINISMRVGRNVLITDPDERKRANEILRAGTTRLPSFPKLTTGLVRKPDDKGAIDIEGRSGLQGRVVFNGRIDLLDNFFQAGWIIVSRHRVPSNLFRADQQKLLSKLHMQYAHVSRGAPEGSYSDVDCDYELWFRKSGRKAFLQRPDKYIYGTVQTIEELPMLVDELSDSLRANGFHL